MDIFVGMFGVAGALGLVCAGDKLAKGQYDLAPFWFKWSGVSLLLYVIIDAIK